MQAQLVGSSGATLASGANVLFDSLLNTSSPSITYAAATGIFTVSAPGTFLVNWWVSVDGTAGPASVAFALRLNGLTDIPSTMPATTGQISGSALVTIGTTPSTLALVNTTGAAVLYGAVTPQANIVISQVI
ncbi:hypothetical protein A7X67_14015 [Clostridium sp. W14A]|nr:hypothetical protein A7X67_14015 [Clostridium sp. W14A]